MGKSVYSLVLSDDVVEAVDRAAYAQGTSRSNFINQVLAEYLSFVTPEKQMRDIFDALIAMVDEGPFAVQSQGSDAMLSLRSPLRVKYNPTIRYTVELFGNGGDRIGALKISTRTQSRQLLALLDSFFLLFCQVETQCLTSRWPQIHPHYQVGQGRLLREFTLLHEDCSSEEIGQAMGRYIRMIDAALGAYAASEPEEQPPLVQHIYETYLQSAQVIV